MIERPYDWKFRLQEQEMLSKVIGLSELFLMVDMKAEVENYSIKMICKENIKGMCNMAEQQSCKKLSSACVKFIVEEGVHMKEEDVRQVPSIAAACLEAYKKWSAARKELDEQEEAEEERRSADRKMRRTGANKNKELLAAIFGTRKC